MMRKSQGASLYQYIIIIALIALFVVPLFFMLGKHVLTYFENLTNSLKQENTEFDYAIQAVMPEFLNIIAAGDLDGTPNQPVKKCENGYCVIDYGDYILKGIPQDFGEYVKSSGHSGGTDVLVDLVMQLANQLDDPATSEDEGKDFRDLANLGHFIAQYEEHIELSAAACQSQPDPIACLNNDSLINSSAVLPDSLKEILPNFYEHYFGVYSLLAFGHAANLCSSTGCDEASLREPVFAFYEKYNEISGSNEYPPEMKAIVSLLYGEIAVMGDEIYIILQRQLDAANGGNDVTQTVYDPVTGANLGFPEYQQLTDLNAVLEPETSAETHLDSALICATGGNPDTGYTCH